MASAETNRYLLGIYKLYIRCPLKDTKLHAAKS